MTQTQDDPYMMSHPSSPPLPNLHGLSISPYPPAIASDPYRYNGVFGPPAQSLSGGWGSPNKRGSRTGIPTNWFDPPSRESPMPQFDPYRREATSPALSPPTSTSSGPTTASSAPYQGYQPPAFPVSVDPYHMAVTPSPPPMAFGGPGMASPNSVPNMNLGYNPAALPQYGSQSLAAIQPRMNGGAWRHTYTPPNMPGPEEDVIPTAIVIKNIPFAVSRETLLGVIESLGAPLPYAFNYHHDNGVFRGLAFANFRAPEEAASVVAALNGYDVQGRKLRVEYKKVLQPGEKEKIEREKALKRMRSIHFDRQDLAVPIQQSAPIGVPIARPTNGSRTDQPEASPPQSAGSSASESLPNTLDMNDPTALDIYSKVLVFKEDRMRDELAFSRTLTAYERRIVHLVAQKLGLRSLTKADGEIKYAVVTREAPPSRPLLTASSSANMSAAFLAPYGGSSEANSPSLRIKKSMPDLRGFNGPVVARDPTRSLTPQRSSGNLRGSLESREYVSMGASAGRRANGFGSGTFNSFFGSAIGDVPPVPPIPSAFGNHSRANTTPSLATSPPDGGSDGIAQPAPLRNPRGPAGESRGFGGSGPTLRTSVSQVIRGSHGGPPPPIGTRVSEESEEEGEVVESARTRGSLDL